MLLIIAQMTSRPGYSICHMKTSDKSHTNNGMMRKNDKPSSETNNYQKPGDVTKIKPNYNQIIPVWPTSISRRRRHLEELRLASDDVYKSLKIPTVFELTESPDLGWSSVLVSSGAWLVQSTLYCSCWTVLCLYQRQIYTVYSQCLGCSVVFNMQQHTVSCST